MLKLEMIYSLAAHKHIEHITGEGKNKIQFDDRGLDKFVNIIDYVNKYLSSKNGKIINIINNNAEMVIYLEIP